MLGCKLTSFQSVEEIELIEKVEADLYFVYGQIKMKMHCQYKKKEYNKKFRVLT